MWRLTYEPNTRALTLRLRDHVGAVQARELADAQADAIAAAADTPFKVLLDLRWTQPLDNEAVGTLLALKLAAAQHPGFRGLVVLVDSATIAMQQKRTSIAEQVPGAIELVTLDPDEATRAFEALSTD